MFRIARWFSAITKTTKVSTYYGDLLGQNRRYAMPADMRLRVTMQQQHRITMTTLNEVDCGFPSLNLLAIESVKHILQKVFVMDIVDAIGTNP
ncbi:MAG TPA: hypothetical protein VHS05_08720 [Pyrinomonadaceae bacterium]|nr:hypothetical protein [Pyrinomonadaceae bacterium]